MKVIIVGGHLAPALAVIDALPKRIKPLFIGRKFALEGDKALSLEYQTIKKRKIPFINLTAGRWQRKFTKHTIPSLFKFPYSAWQALMILWDFKPDIVLGFGGYLSLPVVLTAFILRIPVVIHEQTLGAGFANRISSILAKKICLSWETSAKFFPKDKVIFTGNPIRKFKVTNSELRIANNRLPVLYITGGSAGSHFINGLVFKHLKSLLLKFNIIHQIGDAREFGDFEKLIKIKKLLLLQLRSRYIPTKFIDVEDVGSVLRQADLVVGRAGINTISELIFFKKPALLIPLPFAQNQEQLKNALFLKDLGLGEVLPQKDLNGTKFLQTLTDMFNNININKYRGDASKLKGLTDENSAQKIIEVLENVIFSKKKINPKTA